MALCRNGHDKDAAGVNARGACMECKRIAARTYAARRAAGVPLNERKRQARTDLGYAVIAADHVCFIDDTYCTECGVAQ
jgi:hypothetical protein